MYSQLVTLTVLDGTLIYTTMENDILMIADTQYQVTTLLHGDRALEFFRDLGVYLNELDLLENSGNIMVYSMEH